MEHNNHKKSHHSGAHQNAEAYKQHNHEYKHKHKNYFNSALLLVIISISIVSLAFISEGGELTGFAARESNSEIIQIVVVLDDFKSLESLSPGNYYVDSQGYVYWLDDSSMPLVAKVKNIEEIQKSQQIYIDNEGNVGYIIK